MDRRFPAIRRMQGQDIRAISALHETLLVPYPARFFLHLLLQPTRICLVAHTKDSPDPVAFISAAVDQETESIQILTLGVLPSFQQRRLATRLVHAVVDALAGRIGLTSAAVRVFAQVSTANEAANSFYRHLGMDRASGVMQDMYRGLPGDASGYVVAGRIKIEQVLSR